MDGLPDAVRDYLAAAAVAEGSPAFLRAGDDGAVTAAGGALERYGLSRDAVGGPAEERLDAIVGLVPAGDEPLLLRHVEVLDEVYADVHVFAAEGASWVVLVDRTAWVAERRVAQQLANDMSLLRAELDRKADAGAMPSWRERFDVDETGESRVASVLTAVVRGLATSGVGEPPHDTVRRAGAFARSIMRAIVDEAGVVHALTGERVTAIFGVRPTTVSSAWCAATAAERIVAAVAELNAGRHAYGFAELPVSVGVATGEVAFGALGGVARPRLGALGACVERSPRLADAAGANEVLVDATTKDAVADSPWRLVEARSVDGVATFRAEAR